MRRNAGFTLVEMMIVVAIISLLAAIAVPGFMRARQQSQTSRFLNALRVASNAIETYSAEHSGAYPPDVNRGILPPGFGSYLDATLDWTAATPIGGQWDWDFNVFSVRAAISVVEPGASHERMAEIDAKIDDGDLSTGAFQDKGSGRYSLVIER
jgi:prepilin-type N-terminal cleavage/methylation domain-containing protein